MMRDASVCLGERACVCTVLGGDEGGKEIARRGTTRAAHVDADVARVVVVVERVEEHLRQVEDG
eukprot:7382516-Prymnesium_polylepis.2